jgi:lipopolysaccharide biosynthesis regulator YciM
VGKLEAPPPESGERWVAGQMELANHLEVIGLKERAIDELLRLLEEKPDDVRALRHLVRLYESKNRFAPAISWQKRIVAINEGDVDAHLKLQQLLSTR